MEAQLFHKAPLSRYIHGNLCSVSLNSSRNSDEWGLSNSFALLTIFADYVKGNIFHSIKFLCSMKIICSVLSFNTDIDTKGWFEEGLHRKHHLHPKKGSMGMWQYFCQLKRLVWKFSSRKSHLPLICTIHDTTKKPEKDKDKASLLSGFRGGRIVISRWKGSMALSGSARLNSTQLEPVHSSSVQHMKISAPALMNRRKGMHDLVVPTWTRQQRVYKQGSELALETRC